MALIQNLTHQQLERDVAHREVDCTYSIVTQDDGSRLLQIDSYGSSTRQIPGKKSQSLRFSREAIRQLKEIIEIHHL